MSGKKLVKSIVLLLVVSGATSAQDAQCAKAGADTEKQLFRGICDDEIVLLHA